MTELVKVADIQEVTEGNAISVEVAGEKVATQEEAPQPFRRLWGSLVPAGPIQVCARFVTA